MDVCMYVWKAIHCIIYIITLRPREQLKAYHEVCQSLRAPNTVTIIGCLLLEVR